MTDARPGTSEVQLVLGSLQRSGDGEDISTQLKLNRFFRKLLREALGLGIDRIQFESGTQVRINFFTGGQSVKIITVSGNWFDAIVRWTLDRRNLLLGDTLTLEAGCPSTKEWRASFAARLDDRMVVGDAEASVKLSGDRVLVWKSFAGMPLSAAIDGLHLWQPQRAAFEQMCAGGEGVIVCASPDAQNLELNERLMISMLDAVALGEFKDETLEKVAASATSLAIATMLCGDAVEVLLRLRKLPQLVNDDRFLGVVCQIFPRAVCSGCARAATVQRNVAEILPDQLRPPADSTYLVGRGCQACGEAGFRGVLPVQSVIRMTPELRKLLAKQGGEPEIVRHLHPASLRPLLIDGLEKIMQGKITYESLFQSVRSVSPEYLRTITGASAAGGKHSKDPLTDSPLVADIFSDSTPNAQILRGRAAFTGRDVDDASSVVGTQASARPVEPVFRPDPIPAEDTPEKGIESERLFSVGATGKVRERPLILVVEDDPDQRGILEMLLKSSRYDVAVAADGLEGVEQAEKCMPDLVITDLMMPKLDGRGLVQRIKASKHTAKIPVLVLTVMGDEDYEYTLLNLGADDYCEKTIQRKILLKRVENLIKRSQSTAHGMNIAAAQQIES